MIWALDREGITGAMAEARPEIKRCYEQWLADNPGLAGKMVATMVIEAAEEGAEVAKVHSVDLKDSELDHPFLEGCVLNAMEELRFENPTGDTGRLTVNYPFLFSSEGEDDDDGE